jgi:hypothetical protein
MAYNRFTQLHIPILGSGHGGLKGEVSLVCMLIAFGEFLCKRSGHDLKEVNIVVFKRGETYAPLISAVSIKRAQEFTSRLLAE